MNYWKVIPLSLLIGLLLNLVAFGLRDLMFKGEIGELAFTLMMSIAASILVGVRLIHQKRKNLGWSFLAGGVLVIVFWFGAFLLLSTNAY